MSRKSDGTSTAERVKAFRERLSGSSYKRVEGYITTDEKSRIEAVKRELGVTTDVAVAGLLRMGLERFESSRAPVASGALFTAQMETFEPSSVVTTPGSGMSRGSGLLNPDGSLKSLLPEEFANLTMIHACAACNAGSSVQKSTFNASSSGPSSSLSNGLSTGFATGLSTGLSTGPSDGAAFLANVQATPLADSSRARTVSADAPVSITSAYAASVDHNNDNNPIARFFKHRKETNNV